jgi:NAD(P)-dependent dehydrogenase (short-subunit alcohol dehydrogenase family)
MDRSMSKTALVTGGTDGIGKELARGLAIAGHRVILVGRDREKGEKAANEIKAVAGNAEVLYMRADLSLMCETNRLGQELTNRYSELHYLVLGAGTVRGRRQLTAEGIESTFALNYLSRFALTQRLLPLLEAAGSPGQRARVVLLSGAAQAGKIHLDDVNLTRDFSTIRAVLQFCCANDVFTIGMERRRNAEPSNVAINCLKIGVVKTNIRREFPLWMKILMPIIFDSLLGQTPQEVAKSALRLLLGTQFEGISGGLFLKIKRFRRIQPNRASTDRETATRLFDLSEWMIAEATRTQSSLAPSSRT